MHNDELGKALGGSWYDGVIIPDIKTSRKITESNIVSDTVFKDKAVETLRVIADTLSRSIGYYGSTTIIEDNITGNVITKDGFTILQAIKFGQDDTISNSLLRMIKDVSQSLVISVGDGSTSAIVTSDSLFAALDTLKDNPEFKKIPSRIIMDRLHTLSEEIENVLTNEYAVQITEENFDVLQKIAAVSNNNDEKTGNIIYEIYKEIGKDGFIFMEDTDADHDFYEITNGIEISRGLVDMVYANKPNSMESEYLAPYILQVNGRLDKNDIDWFADFLGYFYQYRNKPLIVIADAYTTEFANFLKINKMNNDRNPSIVYEMGVTTFNTNAYPDEFEDLAVYLNGTILDKSNDEVFWNEIGPFVNRDTVRQELFLNRYLGTARSVMMSKSDSKFVEGAGNKEQIDERISVIQKQIEYFESISNLKEIAPDLFRLNKRIANLQAKIAKLYISGDSKVEKKTRKFLLEDSIFASKSALANGYISGGNLMIPKIIYQGKVEGSDHIDTMLLNAIADSFLFVFDYVLINCGYEDKDSRDEIIQKCLTESSIFNVKSMEYESDEDTDIINSVMTDISIMRSVFSIIGLLVTSNQYIAKMPTKL